MRLCRRCRQEKPLTEFGIKRGAYGGYAYYCGPCARQNAREYKARNPKAVKESSKRYREKNRSEINRKLRELYHANKWKYDARIMVRSAIRLGLLHRGVCEVCGEKNADAHHEDYTKPLDIRWLCTKHHMQLHHGKED